MAYDDATKKQAYRLRRQGIPYKAIARREDQPTSRTLKNWASKGEGTEGEPWEERIERERNEEVITAKAEEVANTSETLDEFFEEALQDSVEAFRQVSSKIKAGAFEAKPKQMSEMLQLVALLKNDGLEKKQLLDEFWRWVLQTTADIMDDRQFARFKARALEKQQKAMEELEPVEHAKMIAGDEEIGG